MLLLCCWFPRRQKECFREEVFMNISSTNTHLFMSLNVSRLINNYTVQHCLVNGLQRVNGTPTLCVPYLQHFILYVMLKLCTFQDGACKYMACAPFTLRPWFRCHCSLVTSFSIHMQACIVSK